MHREVGVVGVGGQLELFRDAHPLERQLVEDAVELAARALVQPGPRLERGLALGAVGALHVAQQAVKVAGLAHEFGRAGGRGLVVPGLEGVLVREVDDDLFALDALVGLGRVEQDRAVGLLELGPPDRGEQGLGQLFLDPHQGGEVFVEKADLVLVERVGGVHRVADRRGRILGLQPAAQRLERLERGDELVEAGGLLEAAGELLVLALDLVEVRTPIGQAGESVQLHMGSLGFVKDSDIIIPKHPAEYNREVGPRAGPRA